MRVKRNNTVAVVRVFTGRNLIEKLYSEGWKVEQREYGLKGIAKSFKSGINKLKNKAAKSLEKQIETSKIKNQELADEATKAVNIDKNITEKLVNKANDDKIGVVISKASDIKGSNIERDMVVDSKAILEGDDISVLPPTLNKRIRSTAKENRKVVFHHPDSGNEDLAHELGHIKNEDKSRLSRYTNSSKVRGELDKSRKELEDNSAVEKERGLIVGARRWIKGKLVEHEESKASKRGLELMKEVGVSKEELKKAEDKLMNKSLGTYKEANKIYYKSPIARKLKNSPED